MHSQHIKPNQEYMATLIGIARNGEGTVSIAMHYLSNSTVMVAVRSHGIQTFMIADNENDLAAFLGRYRNLGLKWEDKSLHGWAIRQLARRILHEEPVKPAPTPVEVRVIFDGPLPAALR